jgi:hypothetical protein
MTTLSLAETTAVNRGVLHTALRSHGHAVPGPELIDPIVENLLARLVPTAAAEAVCLELTALAGHPALQNQEMVFHTTSLCPAPVAAGLLTALIRGADLTDLRWLIVDTTPAAGAVDDLADAAVTAAAVSVYVTAAQIINPISFEDALTSMRSHTRDVLADSDPSIAALL